MKDKNVTKAGGELHHNQIKGYIVDKSLRLAMELSTIISSLRKATAVLYVMVVEE